MIVEAIADYMEAKGIKQAAMCKKTGLPRDCISAVLQGKRKMSLDEYEKICTALCVPYAFFFEHREESA